MLQGRYPRSDQDENVVLAVSVSGSKSSMVDVDDDHKGGALDSRREEPAKDTHLLNRYVDEVLDDSIGDDDEVPMEIKNVVDQYAFQLLLRHLYVLHHTDYLGRNRIIFVMNWIACWNWDSSSLLMVNGRHRYCS